MEIDLQKVLEFAKPLSRSWRFTLGIVLLTTGIACYSLSLAIAAAGAVLLAQEFRKWQLADRAAGGLRCGIWSHGWLPMLK